MVDGGDSQPRPIKEGYGVACDVDILEIWKERNARIFRNASSRSTMIINKIEDEVALWDLDGAKAVSNVMTRE
jgi:hypothetical protein